MCRIHNYLVRKEEEPMKQNSVSQFGGVCAMLLGVVSTLAGMTYLLLPPEQRLEVPGAQFLPSYAANPTMINLISCQLALIGILGLAIVPAIAQLVQSENEGWVRWTSSLAYPRTSPQHCSGICSRRRIHQSRAGSDLEEQPGPAGLVWIRGYRLVDRGH